jgi:outer membrane protein assembly factor BamD
MVMKINFSKLNPLLLIILTIVCFQNNLSANLNPLKWFSEKDRTSEIIEFENDHEEKSERFVKKLTKYKAKGNDQAQQRIYKKILNKYPKASIAKEAAYNRGVYLFNKEKYQDAFKAFSTLKQYHPDSPQLESAIQLQFECAENLMNKTKKKTLGFNNSSTYNTESIPLFVAYAQLFPYNEKAPLALLYSAKVSQSDKEYDTAIFSLKGLIANYPNSEYTAEAYFLIAHIYSDFIKGPEYDLESTREAIRYCEDFIALYPQHEDIKTIEVLYERMLNSLATNRVLMADYYYFNKRDNVAAIIFYNEAITIAPNSQAAIEAQERLDAIEMGIRPTTGGNFIKKLFFIK